MTSAPSRDLPIPASPVRQTTCPSPASARTTSPRFLAISLSLPTSGCGVAGSAGLPLDGDRLEPVVDGGVAHLIVGRPVDEELPRLSGLHEARGEVDRVADHRVLAPRVRADLTAVGGAGGDPGTGWAARQRKQFQTAADGSLLVVLVADRRAEVDEHQAVLVAGRHLTEVAVVAVDHPHGGGQMALQGGD